MIESAMENPLSGCLSQSRKGHVIALPETLSGAAAASVADLILSTRSAPLEIDAAAVGRIDTPCIQVLLAAARLWREDGVALSLTGRSQTFNDNFATLGLSADTLDLGDEDHA